MFSLAIGSAAVEAQDTNKPPALDREDSIVGAVRALSEQVRALQTSVAELRSDSERARAENRELRKEIEDLRAEVSSPRVALTDATWISPDDASPQPSASLSSLSANSEGPRYAPDQVSQESSQSTHAASLEEEYELLSGKVDDQYQTKVESASKYRMRISGIVLMNLFSNQGTVDNIDFPDLAYPRTPGYSDGSFGATLRQSQIGFEVFGPQIAGAKTRADLQLDLAGGFAPVPNGINSGLMRLRTATMRMDWDNTSVVVGQDNLFISPNSPTSFASLAEPALSYAGNLWSWVPQVRVEHRVSLGEESSLLLQGGILDPVSGAVPSASSYSAAGPGESSRQPAYGTRVAWTHNLFGQTLRAGIGGFYGRQDYGYDRNVDAWAATTDLEIPLGPAFSLSGKFYRGRAVGGLYGGLGQSVLFGGSPQDPYTEIIALNSIGGWAQLKYRPARKVELNAAFGIDNPYARDLNYFQQPQSYAGSPLSRNRAGFANVIYRPRSDLLFSAEYRQLETNTVGTGLSGAGHLNLMMGVLF
jgi:hypothetical protein